MENRSLTSYTIFPHKIIIVHLLTCHASAIYTNKVSCLPCMLFTCLLLLPTPITHCWQVQLPKWRCPWDRCPYFRFRSRCVLADIGTLEMLVYNLKSFGNLNFHCGWYYQLSIELKWKLDGKSIPNFMNKNTILPHKIIIVHIPDLSFLCYIYLLSNSPPLYVYLFILNAARQLWIELYLLSLTSLISKWRCMPKLNSTLHAEIRYPLPVSHRSSFGGYGH